MLTKIHKHLLVVSTSTKKRTSKSKYFCFNS